MPQVLQVVEEILLILVKFVSRALIDDHRLPQVILTGVERKSIGNVRNYLHAVVH